MREGTRCPVCKAEYADDVTAVRHYKFFHQLMEYSREIGKEWEFFIDSPS